MPASPARAMRHGRGHGASDGAMHEMAAVEDAMPMPGMRPMAGRRGRHDHGTTGPVWQRALPSTTHCAAGRALGDLTAMVPVEGVGIPGGTMLAETVTGTVLALFFGLSVFRALPAMAERHIGFGESLSRALRADASTIGACLVGQLIALSVLAGIVPMGVGLTRLGFVIMQAAMAVGFLTTYPANHGLVLAGIQEGM